MSATMTSQGHVHRYFEAWNDRDPPAVMATFVEGGTCSDPNVTGPPLSGPALAAYARSLFEGFPDLRFEVPELETLPDGVTSWMGVGIGRRMYTISAWRDEEAARQVMRLDVHRAAVKRFFGEDFAAAVHTGCGAPTTSTPCEFAAPRAGASATPPPPSGATAASPCPGRRGGGDLSRRRRGVPRPSPAG
jgi:SnoaL-like domain